MKLSLITLTLLMSLFSACSSPPEEIKEETPPVAAEPQEVICQGKPSNCEYEIQNICNSYEILGKPIPSFFSTTVTYKVRYRCLEQN